MATAHARISAGVAAQSLLVNPRLDSDPQPSVFDGVVAVDATLFGIGKVIFGGLGSGLALHEDEGQAAQPGAVGGVGAVPPAKGGLMDLGPAPSAARRAATQRAVFPFARLNEVEVVPAPAKTA